MPRVLKVRIMSWYSLENLYTSQKGSAPPLRIKSAPMNVEEMLIIRRGSSAGPPAFVWSYQRTSLVRRVSELFFFTIKTRTYLSVATSWNCAKLFSDYGFSSE